MKHSIDYDVQLAVRECVDKIAQLSSDPNIRSGVMKCAVRDFVWAIEEEYDDRYGLSEHLVTLAELIENKPNDKGA